ncbi:DUF3285 domain-containing protein [Thermosynechococcaceae cyanobacterium BACA0444]|uniref:DUF3285 domain-containing protein n=1 Tax=Pseudocalidococcus azoricus BACA0444 TaxID=2918990 RepID=A0AAE4FVL8_9CYAN|nr:DUF3285 domain-containing protein [Pseudocalidococcus azoricus]MDS3861745.1 DUF3285 domain-containing protein [Pseudocalidococcus azoricus BACA0444]
MTINLPENQSPDSLEPAVDHPASQPTSQDSPPPQDSYVKLAMRNMVKKSGTSLKHFALTTIGLLGVLIGLAYLTR